MAASGPVGAAVDIAEEDRLRAYYYRLLARLLAAPPDTRLLNLTGHIQGDETELGAALKALAEAARAATPEAVTDEYNALFIGVGRGELVPFGSYYMTGFLHEKPLANLRQDMARLQIARADDVREPEDHIAALCDMMDGLIMGAFGAPAGLPEQRAFFDAHIGPWVDRFFEDLTNAESAVFYAPVGRVGRAFMTVETTAFQMDA